MATMFNRGTKDLCFSWKCCLTFPLSKESTISLWEAVGFSQLPEASESFCASIHSRLGEKKTLLDGVHWRHQYVEMPSVELNMMKLLNYSTKEYWIQISEWCSQSLWWRVFVWSAETQMFLSGDDRGWSGDDRGWRLSIDLGGGEKSVEWTGLADT